MTKHDTLLRESSALHTTKFVCAVKLQALKVRPTRRFFNTLCKTRCLLNSKLHYPIWNLICAHHLQHGSAAQCCFCRCCIPSWFSNVLCPWSKDVNVTTLFPFTAWFQHSQVSAFWKPIYPEYWRCPWQQCVDISKKFFAPHNTIWPPTAHANIRLIIDNFNSKMLQQFTELPNHGLGWTAGILKSHDPCLTRPFTPL